MFGTGYRAADFDPWGSVFCELDLLFLDSDRVLTLAYTVASQYLYGTNNCTGTR